MGCENYLVLAEICKTIKEKQPLIITYVSDKGKRLCSVLNLLLPGSENYLVLDEIRPSQLAQDLSGLSPPLSSFGLLSIVSQLIDLRRLATDGSINLSRCKSSKCSLKKFLSGSRSIFSSSSSLQDFLYISRPCIFQKDNQPWESRVCIFM